MLPFLCANLPTGSGGALRLSQSSDNFAIVAPSTTVRSTDVFPASLQKVLSCQLTRGYLSLFESLLLIPFSMKDLLFYLEIKSLYYTAFLFDCRLRKIVMA